MTFIQTLHPPLCTPTCASRVGSDAPPSRRRRCRCRCRCRSPLYVRIDLYSAWRSQALLAVHMGRFGWLCSYGFGYAHTSRPFGALGRLSHDSDSDTDSNANILAAMRNGTPRSGDACCVRAGNGQRFSKRLFPRKMDEVKGRVCACTRLLVIACELATCSACVRKHFAAAAATYTDRAVPG